MAHHTAFCIRCGERLDDGDRTCACCGEQTMEANAIWLIKRVTARRSRSSRDDDAVDDNVFLL